jgi:hypothetical protein
MARKISCSWVLSCSSLFLPFMTDQPNAAEKKPAQRGRVGRAEPTGRQVRKIRLSKGMDRPLLAGQRGPLSGVATEVWEVALAAGCSSRASVAITSRISYGLSNSGRSRCG